MPQARVLAPFHCLLVLTVATALVGCSPQFNWRDVQLDASALRALFPCKPDRATRPIPLANGTLAITMLGCEAGDAMFTLAAASVGDPDRALILQTQWRAATLAQVRASNVATRPASVAAVGKGFAGEPISVTALGLREGNQAIEFHGVWFSTGTHIYQAAIYAKRAPPEVVSTFFDGLKLQ